MVLTRVRDVIGSVYSENSAEDFLKMLEPAK